MVNLLKADEGWSGIIQADGVALTAAQSREADGDGGKEEDDVVHDKVVHQWSKPTEEETGGTHPSVNCIVAIIGGITQVGGWVGGG